MQLVLLKSWEKRKAVEPKIMSNEAMPLHRTMRDEMNESLSDIATAGKKAFSGSAASFAGLDLWGSVHYGQQTP